MNKVLLIFVDGLGLGDDAEYNPLVVVPTPGIRKALGGASISYGCRNWENEKSLVIPLDPCLGIEGIPQSATGQASLFTGVNAAEMLGCHLNGFPNQELHKLLKEKGIFKQIINNGLKATFANAFRPEFFEMIKKGERCFSCSTMANFYADLPFYSMKDVEEGRAIYADITNEDLKSRGYPIEAISPAESANRLAKIVKENDFTLFEYFATDIAGHSGDYSLSIEVISRFDRFINALVDFLDENTLLIITSDHGNIEDIRHNEHTTNLVPAILLGPGRSYFKGKLKSITDITPGIIGYLNEPVS